MDIHSLRSDTLSQYDILEDPLEKTFDSITDLAAHLFDVPIALISLVDAEGQSFTSCYGADSQVGESFRRGIMKTGEALVVGEASGGAQFAEGSHQAHQNGAEGLQFFAGAPLVTPDGHVLGSLCVMDGIPRPLSREGLKRLENLAQMAMDELELRREVAERKKVELELRRMINEYEVVFDSAHDVLFVVSVSSGPEGHGFKYIRFNQAFNEHTGITSEAAIGLTPGELYGEAIGRAFEAEYRRCVDEQASLVFEEEVCFPAGLRSWQTQLSPIIHDGEVKQIIGIARDVTERRALRESLRKDRDLLQRTQQVAQIGGWEYDPQQDVVSGTEEFYRILGLPSDDFELETGLELFIPRDRAKLRTAIEQCLKDGTPYDLEVLLDTLSGERRAVRARGNAIQEREKVVSVAGILQDITQRQEKEEAIRLHRDLLRNIFETSPTAITMVDRNGMVTLGNKRAEEILGIEPSTLASRSYNDPIWHITAPDGGPFPEEELPFARVMQSGGPVFGIEHAIELPDGRRRIFRVNGAPLRSGEGKIISVLFVIDDITERWESAEKLRRSREELAEAQRIARLGSWVHDMQSDELHWSEQTYRLAGWKSDRRVTFDSFLSAVHADDREQVLAGQKLLESGEPVDMQYRFIRPDGEERIFHEQAEAEINAEGEVIRSNGTLRDITEQKRSEAELIAAKEMAEKMNQLKSAFLVNMSHEIRTPLTSIIGFSEMLEDMELASPAPRFAGYIRRAGQRLLETFNDVFELSQLEAGTKSLLTTDVVLQELVYDLLERFEVRAAEAEISLDVDLPPYPVDAVVDRAALDRILKNLIGNAIKFSDRGGKVTVRLRSGIETFSLAVEDTGIGISKAFLPHVFEAFRQESAGNSRNYEGTGLGLTIAKKLVDLMGGTVEVESDPEGGSTVFTVRIPRSGLIRNGIRRHMHA